MTFVEFRVLGPLEVRLDGVPVPLPSGRTRSLLASLLLRANEIVSVDELVERLWDGAPPTPTRAKATLHMVVTRLRQALGDANRVRTAVDGYLVEVAPGTLDLDLFRSLADDGRFAEALTLWRGSPLSNVKSDALHRDEVPVLLDERFDVLERRIDADLAASNLVGLVVELRVLTKQHALRERFWAQLMTALHRSDQQAEALAVYQEIRGLLADELGVEPGSALREAHTAVLAGVPDTGSARPVPWEVQRQLPPDTADFVGREDLHDEVRLLLDPDQAGTAVPIVAISGPPGAGKSALTISIAHRLRRRFPDGQLFVRLDGAGKSPRDPADVLAELLTAVGISLSAIPDSLEARAAAFRSQLADRTVLLVLDDAAGPDQVRPLVPGTAGAAVLISSRRQLPGLPGAHGLRLKPFETHDAVDLLTRMIGTRRIDGESRAATAIVQACGGLPLALRIVGARLAARTSMPLAIFAARLADERRRLDELAIGDLATRASLALSYESLPEPVATAFRRLGLLGATDFASWMVTVLTDGGDGERLVEQLVETSLLDETGQDETGEPRYRLHDLLAVYAGELAVADGDAVNDAALRRYAEALVTLADAACERLPLVVDQMPFLPVEWSPLLTVDEVVRLTRDGGKWMLAEERHLDRVLQLCAERGWAELAAHIAGRAFNYLDVYVSYERLLELLTLVRDSLRRNGNEVLEWRLSFSLTLQTARSGVTTEALRTLTEAVEVFERLDQPVELAVTLAALAYFERLHTGKPAVDLAGRAVEAARRSGSEEIYLSAVRELATMLAQSGRYEESLPLSEEALTISKRLRDIAPQVQVLYGMSTNALANSDLARAVETSRMALDLVDGMDDLRAVGFVSSHAARVAAASGDGATAVELAERARRIFGGVGERLGSLGAIASLTEAYLVLGRYEDVVHLVEEALSQYEDAGLAVHYDRLLQSLALARKGTG
jgi:DNA-binding SARP family transcriptional activator/tetratricopeptide (TPR) repeat protein